MSSVIDAIIEKIGKEPLKQLASGIVPFYKIPVRGKSNSIYNPSTHTLELGKLLQERKFNDVSEIKKAFQTLLIASVIIEARKSGSQPTARNIFYIADAMTLPNGHTPLEHDQSISNSIIQDLELLTGVLREDIGIATEPKATTIAGDFKFFNKIKGKPVDVKANAEGGIASFIPPELNNFDIIDMNKDTAFALVCEKGAVWKSLFDAEYWKKQNCIIMTSNGVPNRATRRMLKLLHRDFKLPVFVMTDADSFGWAMFFSYTVGSMSLSYESDRIVEPEAKFLGVSATDIKTFKIPTMPAKPTDLKRAKEMLSYAWIKSDPFWVAELNEFIKEKKKTEIDALARPGHFNYLQDVYLPTKLKAFGL